jgi:hypothetical protein
LFDLSCKSNEATPLKRLVGDEADIDWYTKSKLKSAEIKFKHFKTAQKYKTAAAKLSDGVTTLEEPSKNESNQSELLS